MYKLLAAIAGTAAILVVATLVPSSVKAGASSSAPSKYTHQNRGDLRADRQNYPITEYSSSSRRTTPKH